MELMSFEEWVNIQKSYGANIKIIDNPHFDEIREDFERQEFSNFFDTFWDNISEDDYCKYNCDNKSVTSLPPSEDMCKDCWGNCDFTNAFEDHIETLVSPLEQIEVLVVTDEDGDEDYLDLKEEYKCQVKCGKKLIKEYEKF